MKKLLSSEDSGVGMSGTNDPVLDMAMTAYMSLMMLAVKIDGKNEEEQKAAISAMADGRRIDLTSLVQGMKSCSISVGENGKAVIAADNGTVKVSRELTMAEMSRLSQTLNDGNLTDDAKRMRVAGMVTGIVAQQQVSQNFEQGMEQQEGIQQNIQR